MANIHFSGEKAEKKEAKKQLMSHVADVFDGRYAVEFESDDGGNHITLFLEVQEPSETLDRALSEALWFPKWMGWRYLVIKVPIGYIDAILYVTKRDDY